MKICGNLLNFPCYFEQNYKNSGVKIKGKANRCQLSSERVGEEHDKEVEEALKAWFPQEP